MKYCKSCSYQDTKPLLKLNDDGVCDACINWGEKYSTDWNLRRQQLDKIVTNDKKILKGEPSISLNDGSKIFLSVK